MSFFLPVLLPGLQLSLEEIALTTQTLDIADGELVVITLLFEVVPELGVLRTQTVPLPQYGLERCTRRIAGVRVCCEHGVDGDGGADDGIFAVQGMGGRCRRG